MTEQSFQLAILEQVVALLEPVTSAAVNPERRRQLLDDLGWDLAAVSGFDAATLEEWIEDVGHAVEGVVALIEAGGPDSLEDLRNALPTAAAAVRVATGLPPTLTGNLPAELPAETMAQDLLTHLVVTALSRRSTLALRLAVFLGLVTPVEDVEVSEPLPPTGAAIRMARRRPELHLERVVDLLTDPVSMLRELYFPLGQSTAADADLASRLLFPRLAALLQAAGVRATYGLKPSLGPDLGPFGEALAGHMLNLSAQVPIGPARATLGASLALSSPDRGGLGLVVMPRGQLQFSTVAGGWGLRFELGGSSAAFSLGQHGLVVHGGGESVSLDVEAVKLSGQGGFALLIGSTTGTRLQVGSLVMSGQARLGAGRDDYALSLAAESAAFVVAGGDGDGFLQRVLPADGVKVAFDCGVGWSKRGGLALKGAAGLEGTLPVHVSLGPLNIPSVFVRARGDQQGVALALAATADVKLGPLQATVERTGLEATVTFPIGGGNAGPAQIDIGFKPPDGVGLTIDAGAITGGGFLSFDPVNERYAGALRLKVEGGIILNAFGLLTTRMPDRSPGFSLLVLVQASGFTPVPLGFSFTLTGVGGLLGVNRTVDVEVLRAGLRNKTLDAVLFSKDDPIPRAPQIVTTLQSVFPPAPDQYVFGPMVQITWGPPPNPLLTIEVALILELPAPLRLIVLGRVQASLPTPTHAIVKLRLDVVGVIDFDRRQVAVDATLYDSFVGPFALTGDMAARASWGDEPDFAVALGGFHPAFRPPEGFPELRRLALTLSSTDNPRLRMEAYLALTSNTVQIGARLDFYVAAAGFSLEGGFGFDTLITLSPFRLQAEIDAGLTLKQDSTTLAHLGVHMNLVGPAPWEVWGTATISILLLDISVPFHATFGEPQAVPEPERVDVWALLDGQLSHPSNWSTQLPPEDNRRATLVALPGDGDGLVHPLGAVSVTQRLVPLERTLSLFGTAPPLEASFFEITGGDGLVMGDDVYDYFAPAQFRRMTDAEKLSSPSFDRMVSGAQFGPRADAVVAGTVQEASLAYETALVLDLADPTRQRPQTTYRPAGDTVASIAERSPAGLAELRDQGREKFAPPTPGRSLAEPEYVVATRDTLATEVDGYDGTYSGAVEALRRRGDPELFQIVRREETELATL